MSGFPLAVAAVAAADDEGSGGERVADLAAIAAIGHGKEGREVGFCWRVGGGCGHCVFLRIDELVK